MELHTLSSLGEVKFSTTDEDDFLSKCETLYQDVSDEDWEDYTSIEELPSIFENHGYFYNVHNANKILNIDDYSALVNLYFKLQQHNPTFNFDNGTSLVIACNYLLSNHNEATMKYINDNNNEVSLLSEIVGGNGVEQLSFHKQFLDSWNVYIY